MHNDTAVITRLIKEQAEIAGVPQRDIPTIEELLDQARVDDTMKKTLQHTLAELEFQDTEIDFD